MWNDDKCCNVSTYQWFRPLKFVSMCLGSTSTARAEEWQQNYGKPVCYSGRMDECEQKWQRGGVRWNVPAGKWAFKGVAWDARYPVGLGSWDSEFAVVIHGLNMPQKMKFFSKTFFLANQGPQMSDLSAATESQGLTTHKCRQMGNLGQERVSWPCVASVLLFFFYFGIAVFSMLSDWTFSVWDMLRPQENEHIPGKDKEKEKRQ